LQRNREEQGMARQWREVRYGGAMIDQKEIDAVVGVMKTSMAVGEQVRSFEKRCAELMGHKHGVMVNSGSSALMVAMRLLDLPKGSEVITPVLTFSTDIASIVHAGYVPAFVDVEPDTYQIDIGRIERMIGPKTKAMLVPNLIGNVPDWDRLRELADRHGLKLIEDSCDTLGSTLRGRAIGERADISVTSFSIFHVITCLGNGGLVAVRDPKQWDRGLVLRAWGRASERYLHGSTQKGTDDRFDYVLEGIGYDSFFVFEDMSYGFIPNEAGAAFGHQQLDKLDMFFKLRQSRFDRHTKFLSRFPDAFIVPRVMPEVHTTWICYPLQLREETGWKRSDFQLKLEKAGIWTRTIFSGNATRQPMMKGVEYRADADGYPAADQIMRNGLMLPCHPSMTDEECDYVYEVIEEFMAERQYRPKH
jgi:CDP-6-deoxy-D-xylo-4-hexulose-3-dehydrase